MKRRRSRDELMRDPWARSGGGGAGRVWHDPGVCETESGSAGGRKPDFPQK